MRASASSSCQPPPPAESSQPGVVQYSYRTRDRTNPSIHPHQSMRALGRGGRLRPARATPHAQRSLGHIAHEARAHVLTLSLTHSISQPLNLSTSLCLSVCLALALSPSLDRLGVPLTRTRLSAPKARAFVAAASVPDRRHAFTPPQKSELKARRPPAVQPSMSFDCMPSVITSSCVSIARSGQRMQYT